MKGKDNDTIQEFLSEKINVQKQRNILKTQLKIVGIYCAVIFVISMNYCFLTSMFDFNLKDIIQGILYCFSFPIILFIFLCLIFSPTIIVLYFLFKKIKETKTRILLVSFLIPFTNMIYFYIDKLFSDGFLTQMIGFYALMIVVPLLCFSTLVVPKSLLPQKKEFLVTLGLMLAFGWGLVFFSWFSVDFINDSYTNLHLKQYDTIIENLENYKKDNGVYPDTIEDTVKSFKEFKYEAKDENRGFIINVGNHWTISYNYCSDKDYYECQEGWHRSGKYTKIGKWIKADYSD